jgi:hypothetical protein
MDVGQAQRLLPARHLVDAGVPRGALRTGALARSDTRGSGDASGRSSREASRCMEAVRTRVQTKA